MTGFRRSIAVFASVLAVGAVLASGASAAARTTVHVRNTLSGAQIAAGENVYAIRGSTRGAAVQFTKEDSAGTGGTFTGTSYFGNGSIVLVGQYTNSLPDANGIVTIHSKGRYVRGTGVYKDITGKFTASGTLNAKNGLLKIVLVGTQTY